jgi:hypothetical protein
MRSKPAVEGDALQGRDREGVITTVRAALTTRDTRTFLGGELGQRGREAARNFDPEGMYSGERSLDYDGQMALHLVLVEEVA